MNIFYTVGHTAAYALIQTAAFALFALALFRLKKIKSMPLAKAFFFILTVNIAGTLTFGEDSWQRTSMPVADVFFLAGMGVFFAAHLWLAARRIFRK